MPEIRKDPFSSGWTIIAPERRKRPQHFDIHEPLETKGSSCPFCPGNEKLTPPDVYRSRGDGADAGGKAWEVRVFPNKYPALRVEGLLTHHPQGLFDLVSGIGAHEVIVEVPDHGKDICDFPAKQCLQVLVAIRSRLLDLKNDFRLRHISVFKNFGAAAGATIPHAHTQLLASPLLPERLQNELAILEGHYQTKERCLHCDILANERESGKRLLWENSSFTVIAPFAAAFPFELNIYPQRHNHAFEGSNNEELAELAEIFCRTLLRLKKVLQNPAYNLVLHNGPFKGDHQPYFHWRLALKPVLNRVAGFEWGSGCAINPIPPEEAIAALKSIGKV